MLVRLVFWLFALACLAPTQVHAQYSGKYITVRSPGYTWLSNTVSAAEQSTSYIEISGYGPGGELLFTDRCEPNTTCRRTTPKATSYSSRLVYDSSREKLMSCSTIDGTPPTNGECTNGNGIVSATLDLRLGKLKIIADQAPGYESLLLDTSGSSIRFEFAESASDFWQRSYKWATQVRPEFNPFPVGSYRVKAEDLPAHCAPTQTNTDLMVTVPEDGEVEVTILFKGNQCRVTIERHLIDGAGGTIISTPAGITCGEGAGDCIGSFAYGTEVTFRPAPNEGSTWTWYPSQGCKTGALPCTQAITSDAKRELEFKPGVAPSEPDAGTSEADAGGSPAQSDAGTTAGDAGNGGQGSSGGSGDGNGAGTGTNNGAPGDDNGQGAASGQDAGQGESESASGDDGCAIMAPGARETGVGFAELGLLVAGLMYVRRRARRGRDEGPV